MKKVLKLNPLAQNVANSFVVICLSLFLSTACLAVSKAEALQKIKQLGGEFTADEFADMLISGDVEVAHLFLIAGMPATVKNKDGQAMMCLDSLPVESLTLLIENGADPNIKCGRLNEPRIFNDVRGTGSLVIPTIELLVSKGANINAKGYDGRTPLHVAVVGSNDDTVAFLLSLGANVNAKNDQGWTPLHYAAGHSTLSVVKLLLDKGASLNERGAANMSVRNATPLGVALANGRGEKNIAVYLRSKGAIQ